VFTKEGIYS